MRMLASIVVVVFSLVAVDPTGSRPDLARRSAVGA